MVICFFWLDLWFWMPYEEDWIHSRVCQCYSEFA